MTQHIGDLISDALLLPASAISYAVSRKLHLMFPERVLVEGAFPAFDVESYAGAGLCSMQQRIAPYGQRVTHWAGEDEDELPNSGSNVWYRIEWESRKLDLLTMSWVDGMSGTIHHYVLADTREVAEGFIRAVCAWNMELRDEVLVFEGGCWQKDEELFQAIKSATLDNLILRGDLKETIVDDLAGFFRNRETYAEYGVPWKRGILFVGPAGNGKTHAVKALINALGQDCLYVKSFRSQLPDEYSIRAVFARARMTTPCVLVLEDLDSLVTSSNRSYFLNELDGFAGNDGILTLATTNHPERLDPAIVDRPSRFDRKYPFDLPGVEERGRYIHMWNETLQPELRLTEDGPAIVAEQTEGFSFAYLKELFISSMMRWVNAPRPGAMDAVMQEQVEVLREQMASAIVMDEPPVEEDMESMEGMLPPGMMRAHAHRMFGWQAYGPSQRRR